MAESPAQIMLEDAETLHTRQAVWSALSDLFLDTDVALHYPGITRVCALSPYSLPELEHILYREVALCAAPIYSMSVANGPVSMNSGSRRVLCCSSLLLPVFGKD